MTSNTSAYAGILVSVLIDEGDVLNNVEDITDQIPVVDFNFGRHKPNWHFIPDVTHNKAGNWSSCMAVAHRVTPELAMLYAENDFDVTFFFYVKGERVVLENTQVFPTTVRIFHFGDAVFFKGKPEHTVDWNAASGLSDGYVKR